MEFEILYLLQSLHGTVQDRMMVAITSLGSAGWFWIALTVLFLWIPKYRRCGRAMAFALLVDVLICNVILKNMIARERPCWLDPSVELLVRIPKDYSFPSGHTGASFAAAAAVFLHHRREGAAALLLAVLIAFSRLYLFVHFPTDVLAGAVIGTAAAFAGWAWSDPLWRKISSRRDKRAV